MQDVQLLVYLPIVSLSTLKKKANLCMECSNCHFPLLRRKQGNAVLKHEEGRRTQKSHQSKPPSRNLDTLAWCLWSELSKHGGLSPG